MTLVPQPGRLAEHAERLGQWTSRDARQILYREHTRSIERLQRLLPFALPHNRSLIEDEISILTRKCQSLADWESREIHKAEDN